MWIKAKARGLEHFLYEGLKIFERSRKDFIANKFAEEVGIDHLQRVI